MILFIMVLEKDIEGFKVYLSNLWELCRLFDGYTADIAKKLVDLNKFSMALIKILDFYTNEKESKQLYSFELDEKEYKRLLQNHISDNSLIEKCIDLKKDINKRIMEIYAYIFGGNNSIYDKLQIIQKEKKLLEKFFRENGWWSRDTMLESFINNLNEWFSFWFILLTNIKKWNNNKYSIIDMLRAINEIKLKRRLKREKDLFDILIENKVELDMMLEEYSKIG